MIDMLHKCIQVPMPVNQIYFILTKENVKGWCRFPCDLEYPSLTNVSADVDPEQSRAQPYQLARLPAGRLAQPSTLVTFFQNNLEHHRPFNI